MPEEISKRTVVCPAPGVDDVIVRRDVSWTSGLTMDLYHPPGAKSGKLPAIVIVGGYPDPGFEKFVGCKFKDMGSTTSWARLFAASGVAAIAYVNRDPATDLHTLMSYLRHNAASLQIDATRIAVWASSGNVPVALSLLLRDSKLQPKCAVFCYGYTLNVAEEAAKFHFANPCAGKSIEDLADGIAIFVARAGRDETPRLNETLDRFVLQAIQRNLPLTFVNHPTGPHAFDLFDDSRTTRDIVNQTLDFVRQRV